jgi:hypothetical protein
MPEMSAVNCSRSRSRMTMTWNKWPFGGPSHSCHAVTHNPARPASWYSPAATLRKYPFSCLWSCCHPFPPNLWVLHHIIRPHQPANIFSLDKPIDRATNWRDNASSSSAALPLELVVHTTATSSTSIIGRLQAPSPTAPLSSARHRCSRCAAPPSTEGSDLTF